MEDCWTAHCCRSGAHFPDCEYLSFGAVALGKRSQCHNNRMSTIVVLCSAGDVIVATGARIEGGCLRNGANAWAAHCSLIKWHNAFSSCSCTDSRCVHCHPLVRFIAPSRGSHHCHCHCRQVRVSSAWLRALHAYCRQKEVIRRHAGRLWCSHSVRAAASRYICCVSAFRAGGTRSAQVRRLQISHMGLYACSHLPIEYAIRAFRYGALLRIIGGTLQGR